MNDIENYLFKLNYKLDLLIKIHSCDLKDEFKTDSGTNKKLDTIGKDYIKDESPKESSHKILNYAIHID